MSSFSVSTTVLRIAKANPNRKELWMHLKTGNLWIGTDEAMLTQGTYGGFELPIHNVVHKLDWKGDIFAVSDSTGATINMLEFVDETSDLRQPQRPTGGKPVSGFDWQRVVNFRGQ